MYRQQLAGFFASVPGGIVALKDNLLSSHPLSSRIPNQNHRIVTITYNTLYIYAVFLTKVEHILSSQSVQSLNYQSVRFKLPPPNVDMGWRLELRVCDVQLTDLENAAFVTFVVLLSRLISDESNDFLMPISKVCGYTVA